MYSTAELKAPIVGVARTIEREDGTRLHSVVVGSGAKTLVFAHGYGANKDEWNIICQKLDPSVYRSIVFDQRGHGESTIGSDGISSDSMASDYEAVLEAYDVRDGVLAAHSMGGFLAQKFMLTYPEVANARLKGCLLIATFAGDVNKQNFQNRLQIPLIKSGILLRLIKNKAIGRAFTRTLIGERWEASMSDAFLEIFMALDHKPLVPILSALGDESYYTQLERISIPCTIIVGTRDHTTPAFHTDDMHANIPRSKVVKVDGAGHLINWEAPDALISEIHALA